MHIFFRFRFGGGLQQHEGLQKVGTTNRQAHPDKASHGEAQEMTGGTLKRFDKTSGIFAERIDVVTGFSDLALTLSPKVEGNAAKPILERIHLIVEHAPTPQEPMCKDDGFRTGAMLFEVDIRVIDVQPWHFSPQK